MSQFGEKMTSDYPDSRSVGDGWIMPIGDDRDDVPLWRPKRVWARHNWFFRSGDAFFLSYEEKTEFDMWYIVDARKGVGRKGRKERQVNN